ncbi:MAG: extracellular solute-binding protein [Clostridia bacterium]|nr:extracellular solute-binding protein [Clostridia bacterium]
MLFSFNKHFKMIVCLLLCASMFCSCGVIVFNTPQDTDNTEETESSLETKEPYEVEEYDPYYSKFDENFQDFMLDISNSDYNGGTFLIANMKEPLIIGDENSSPIISQEYEYRNAYVEQKLNIRLAEKIVDPDTMYNEIRQAIKSSTYYADLILLPQEKIGEYSVEGLIANMSGLPGIKFDADYYNSTSVASAGGNSKIFGVAGDACASYDSHSAVFFNKTLLSQLTDENLYKIVDSGSWTWSKFLGYADSVSGLGEGYYSVGYQNTSEYIQDLIFISSGMQFTTCEYGQMPQIAFDAETANPVVDVIKSVINHPSKFANDEEAIANFANGNTLFLIEKLNTMETLSTSQADWGIVPLPKYSEEQENYRSLVSAENAMFFAMVPTVSDSQKIADVLAMINISSYKETPDAIANDAMSYYLRDNASTKNVARILNSAVYDLAYSFSSESKAISNATYNNIRNASIGKSSVKSYLKSWSRSFDIAMNKVFEN